MKFAKYTFLLSGIYGLLVLLPYYFFEDKVGVDTPPAITHPEFFYGFIGLASVFQLLFLVIASDPLKYRLLILISVSEKLSFGVAALVLYAQSRLEGVFFYGAIVDLLLAVLFTISFFVTPPENAAETPAQPVC